MNIIRLFLPIILFTAFSAVAQSRNQSNSGLANIECGTPTPLPKIAQEHEKRMQQFMQRGSNLVSPEVISVKAHIVRRSDGSGGLPVDTLNAAIAVMNAKFSNVNMSFSLCGSIHYIDSDELYTLDIDVENSALVLNNINDAINIYFVGNLVSNGIPINGISDFPSGSPANNRIIMWNDATRNRITLPHEMGHYWNLYHTHEILLGAELVNGSNCSTAGDLVCDTPADPCCYFYDSDTCTYTGTGTDANGQAYTPMVNNLMSYYGACRDIFTLGQYSRIDAGYALRKSYTGANSYTFTCNTAVASAPTNISLTNVNCGVNITWSDNANNEMGYIIEASTSANGPFVAIGNMAANTTSFNDSRLLTSGTTYYYRVIAANANANYSAVAQIFFNSGINCYCTPLSLNCTEGDAITNVRIQKNTTIMSFTSGCETNGYSIDSTSVPTLEKGTTYTIFLSNASSYQAGATTWIDFNRNGAFENSEIVFTQASALWAEVSGSFSVPLTALEGPLRMRVRLTYNSVPLDPCINPALAQGYGETEDYWINIACGIDSVTSATRCGSGSVTLSASGCPGGTLGWFTTTTESLPVATGNSYTTPTLSLQTTYYVGCISGGCSTNRIPVTANIVFTNLSFTSLSEPAGTFLATEAITSNINVLSGTNYYAGKSIMLTPGFQADINKLFTASIQNISCQ